MACRLGECIKYTCIPPKGPPDGAVYAPYVKMTFAGDKIITVGNQSSPATNLSIITSFNYGFTPNATGQGVTVEILDVGGVIYRQVVRALNKTIAKTKDDIGTAEVDFGWIITDCEGQSRLHSCFLLNGYKPRGMIYELEASFENGNVKIKMEIRGTVVNVPESPHAGASSGEDQKITLKEALRKLFTEKEPRFDGVEFRDKDGGGNFYFSRSDGSSGDGPKATWPYEQQNTITTARMWLSSCVTENDLGCLLLYDNKRNFVIVQEDPTQKKKADCTNSIGSYVVNGGNCSDVLSFTPKVKFNAAQNAGAGGAASGASSGDASQQTEPTIEAQQAGVQTSVATQQHEWQFRSPESHANKALIANNKHLDAARAVGEGVTPVPFEAELKIIGDPQFSDPLKLVNKTLAIVFINPFYLGSDCTWIQTSNCNSMLSNRSYLITGVCHQIQNGSYTTTFNLKLMLPNIDIDYNAPIGGDGTEYLVEGENGFGQSLPIDATQNND
jgi:hypothetical protein